MDDLDKKIMENNERANSILELYNNYKDISHQVGANIIINGIEEFLESLKQPFDEVSEIKAQLECGLNRFNLLSKEVKSLDQENQCLKNKLMAQENHALSVEKHIKTKTNEIRSTCKRLIYFNFILMILILFLILKTF